MTMDRILAYARRPIPDWVRSSLQRPVGSPRAPERPTIHTAGVDPVRILLVAQEVAISYGVLSHDIGFAGHLARQISLLTTRAVDLTIVLTKSHTLTRTVLSLPVEELLGIDAIVIVVDGTEALAHASLSTLRRHLGYGLDHLASEGPPVLPICLATVTSINESVPVPGAILRLLNRYLRHLDAEVRAESTDRAQVSVVGFDPPPGREAAVHGYLDWARAIAPTIAAAIDPLNGSRRMPGKADEAARQLALEELGVLDSGPNRAIDRITTMAKDLFEVSEAFVVFIDRDRQWVKSAAGSWSQELPRARAFSAVTIERPGVHLIEDATKVDTFKDDPSVTGPDHVRSYAGYPIEGPTGYRLGALYLIDTKPRRFSPRELALLRDLALQVQSELWERQV